MNVQNVSCSFAGIRKVESTGSIHTGQVEGGRQHYADTEIVCVAKGRVQAVIVLVAMLARHVVLTGV
jgi:hypothetical protein